MNLNRRQFLKLSGSAAATATVAGSGLLTGCSSGPRRPGTGEIASSPTICDICFWKCAGTVYTENGKPWKVVGNPDDVHSNGRLCTRGTGGIGSYMDRDRLTKPLMRVERNGKQVFEPVDWNQALNFIASRMRKIAEEQGEDRIALFSHGAGGAHFKHLLKSFGADSYAAPSFAQCRGPREVAFKLTYGEGVGSPDRTDMENSRCIVLIGSHIGENLHNGQVQTLTRAIENGATLITVDPRFSVPAGKSKHWLAIEPGTDIALLLAWMNVIIGEELYDKDYVNKNTTGLPQLARHVRPFTPEWAWLQTGIEPDKIRASARDMAAAAPATLIHPGRHVTWYGDDTQRSRAIAILNALLGSWGRPGGFYYQEKVKLPKFPLPKYPHAKTTEKIANKGKFPFASSGVTNAVIDASIGEDAHYKGWFIYGTNLPMSLPGITHKLRQAADQLDLVVVVDIVPAEVIGYADIVLPECSYLERYDDLRNSPERIPSLALRMPAFEPLGDSKPGWWIAKQLGERLGLEKYFPWNDYSEVLDWQLKQVGSSLEEMQRIGVKNFHRKTPEYLDDDAPFRFGTPSGKIELYSQQLKDAGFDPMPVYTPPQKPPEDYYRLIYGRAPAHTFGRTSNNPLLFELMPENAVWVNPIAAQRWGLNSGDYIRLKNTEGTMSNRVRVRVTERIRPDSLFMAHGFGHTERGLRLASGVGANDAELMSHVKIDPIMGGTGMRSNFVTLVKEEV